MKIGKPIKYIAVPPGEALERIKKTIKEDAEKQTAALEELNGSEVLKELKLLHSQGVDLVDPGDMSGSLKGRSNIYHHLDLMVKNAKERITIMTTSKGVLRKTEALKNSLKKAKEKGVEIRIAAPVTKDTQKILEDLKGVAEVRHTEDPISRFFVVDGKDLTFMLMEDDNVHPSYDAGVWVNTEFFASSLEKMFEAVWKDMPPADKTT